MCCIFGSLFVVRVTGDPGNLILTQIGSGLASDKKRRDERGWYTVSLIIINQVTKVLSDTFPGSATDICH